jgi:hypothetical protein
MRLKDILSIEFLLILIVPVVYIYSWQSFALSTLLSLMFVFIVLFFYHTFLDFLYFFLGLLLGSIGEIACVYFGAWSYTKPHYLGIPLWLSIFWGYGFLIMRRLEFKILSTEKKHNNDKSIDKQYFFLLIIYCLLIFIPSLLFRYNTIVFILLLCINISLLYKINSEKVFFGIIFGLLGPIMEIICIHMGIWKYANPDFLGIPFWLILLYSGFAIFIKRLTKKFRNLLRLT